MSVDKCVNENDGVIKYISIIQDLKQDGKIVVYRGETRDFGKTACQPNVFRNGYLDNNERFEKNILDEMTANHIAKGDSYLEKAINAQHGGFPSRLLDVSYNSLVALFFATTPFYNKIITESDGEDAYVYVFSLDEMFCPVGDGIKDNYTALISDEYEWYSKKNLFNRNFKLIDHIKTNSRIIAQQGAFILFQGMDAYPVPSNLYKTIKIHKNEKPHIRKQLKDLFGIHMGTIYPEENNLVGEIIGKSKITNSMSFSLENELQLVFKSLENDVDHLLCKILLNDNVSLIEEFEMTVIWYKIGWIELSKHIDSEEKKVIEKFKIKYNNYINMAIYKIMKKHQEVFINKKELLI